MRSVNASVLAACLFLGAVAETQGFAAEIDVQGHRGCRGLAPENTMAAFEKAIELRVTTIELDIVMTRDGIFAVHHDLRLNPKLCASPDGEPLRRQAVADLDFSDLSELDCGSRRLSKFPDQVLSPGERIPKLEQVLDLAIGAPYPVQVSIEIKQSMEGMPQSLEEVIADLVSLVRERGLQQRATIQSKSGEVLVEVRNQAPELERALVLKSASARPWVENGTATIISREHVYLNRREVENLKDQGVRVIPWTVNNPKAIRKVLDWGVDGIISDYPDRVLAILAARSP